MSKNYEVYLHKAQEIYVIYTREYEEAEFLLCFLAVIFHESLWFEYVLRCVVMKSTGAPSPKIYI